MGHTGPEAGACSQQGQTAPSGVGPGVVKGRDSPETKRPPHGGGSRDTPPARRRGARRGKGEPTPSLPPPPPPPLPPAFAPCRAGETKGRRGAPLGPGPPAGRERERDRGERPEIPQSPRPRRETLPRPPLPPGRSTGKPRPKASHVGKGGGRGGSAARGRLPPLRGRQGKEGGRQGKEGEHRGRGLPSRPPSLPPGVTRSLPPPRLTCLLLT